VNYLLWSPVAFLVLLGAAAAFYRLLGVLSLPSTGTGGGKLKAYACGEDVAENRVQPDYTQFFPFAFFFTIMHVFALIVATVPGASLPAVGMAVGYVVAAAIGLFILFRE
jgi:NADH:ubiquinone oxidoreductase subunit 3 (subunit A)